MSKIAFIDVDDTLVRSTGSKRIRMPASIEYVRELHRDSFELYCWSAGGADYARSSAVELGIADCFAGFLPKPTLILDDQAPEEWPSFRHIHPASLPL